MSCAPVKLNEREQMNTCLYRICSLVSQGFMKHTPDAFSCFLCDPYFLELCGSLTTKWTKQDLIFAKFDAIPTNNTPGVSYHLSSMCSSKLEKTTNSFQLEPKLNQEKYVWIRLSLGKGVVIDKNRYMGMGKVRIACHTGMWQHLH